MSAFADRSCPLLYLWKIAATPVSQPRKCPQAPNLQSQKPLTRWFLFTDTPSLFARNEKMSGLINSWLPLLLLKSQVLCWSFLCEPWEKHIKEIPLGQKFVHLGTGAMTNACREEKRFLCFLVLFSPLRCFQRLERRAELKNQLNLLLLKAKVDVNNQLSLPPLLAQQPRWLGSLITEMRAGQDLSSPLPFHLARKNCFLWSLSLSLVEFYTMLQEESAPDFLWECSPQRKIWLIRWGFLWVRLIPLFWDSPCLLCALWSHEMIQFSTFSTSEEENCIIIKILFGKTRRLGP